MSSSSPRSAAHLEPASARELRVWHRAAVLRVLMGFAVVGAVVAYGTIGFVMLGWTFFDALFMVVITISGVGYGEVRPMASNAERIHSMMIIAFGLVSVAYTLAGFVQYLTEGQIRNYLGRQRMKRQIDDLKGHTVLVGFGRIGNLVAEDLAAARVPFLIIEQSAERLAEIDRRGFLYFHGNATQEETLLAVGLDRARSLVTVLPEDASNVFLTLTARRLFPDIEIIARAEQPSTLKTLHQAGANHVVMPAAIGAHRIISLLTNPSSVEFAELVTRRSSLAIEMEEIPVRHRGPLDGLSLRDADIGRRTGVMVVAVKRADGRVEFPPSGDEPFAAGDTAVLLGQRSALDLFRRSFEA